MIVPIGAHGADYVTRKAPALLRANGISYVTRYITRGSSYKRLQPPERDELLAAGFGITLVWETGIDAINGGAQQGTLDGREAAKQATLLGYPPSCDILAAVDTDVYAGNLANCRNYLRAFHANCGPYGMGLYGDEDAYACVVDVCGVWCLPNASGWSPQYRRYVQSNGLLGKPFNGHILQGHEDKTLGMDVPNLCTKPFPAWSLHSDPKPTPSFPSVSQEDDMRLLTNGEPRDINDGHGPYPAGVVFYELDQADNVSHIEGTARGIAIVNARGGPAGAQKVSNVDLDALGAI